MGPGLGVQLDYVSISAMREYAHKSAEELRWEDYLADNTVWHTVPWRLLRGSIAFSPSPAILFLSSGFVI